MTEMGMTESEALLRIKDMEFDRQTEFNIVRMIVDAVELYEKGVRG